ncbi:hypothetical protein Tco_1228793 [Tanacetum coccineum]
MGGRRSKQDIINTVGTMGLKGIETSWNNSTAKVHEGTDEVLEGTAQEYESTAGANLSTAEVYESTAHSLFKMRVLIIPFSRSHGKTVITHSLTVGSSRNFERRKEGFWIRLCKGNNESRMVQTECMYDVRFTWMSRRSMLYVHQCIKGFKFVLPSFVNSYCRRRSKQDIINTVGTMGLKGLETSWNNSTAKVHEGTDEVLEGTAQEYESTAGANLSTAEVYESTAHSLFKCLIEDEDLSRDRDSFFLIVRHGGQFEYWKAGLVVVVRLGLVVVIIVRDDDEKPCINNNDSMFEYSAFVINLS